MEVNKLFKRPKTYFLAILTLIGVYVIISIARSFGGGVPVEFVEARLQGALIAQNIVDLSNQSTENLKAINDFDKQRNYKPALELAGKVVTQSQEVRNEAVKLSGELEKMTRALSDLKSFEARQAALQGISNHLALLTRLINYSGYLSELLEILRGRFEGNLAFSNRVGILVEQINAEVNAVNNFNKQAIQAMGRFDTIVK